MAQNQTPTTELTLLQATRLTFEIFGREETERALREVFFLPDEEVTVLMQQLNANSN